uniref:Uncharacterized protein n=1 Tax=Oryza sativa subsp. japonica TaxID=39947 RepID=Q8H593_ORYSJ|nr:hypothetical protein [Oryza sativa Japonica Group]
MAMARGRAVCGVDNGELHRVAVVAEQEEIVAAVHELPLGGGSAAVGRNKAGGGGGGEEDWRRATQDDEEEAGVAGVALTSAVGKGRGRSISRRISSPSTSTPPVADSCVPTTRAAARHRPSQADRPRRRPSGSTTWLSPPLSAPPPLQIDRSNDDDVASAWALTTTATARRRGGKPTAARPAACARRRSPLPPPPLPRRRADTTFLIWFGRCADTTSGLTAAYSAYSVATAAAAAAASFAATAAYFVACLDLELRMCTPRPCGNRCPHTTKAATTLTASIDDEHVAWLTARATNEKIGEIEY